MSDETAAQLGSWAVVYDDGDVLAQYDESRPEFLKNAGEVPFKAIDWRRVVQLRLENQYVQSVFDIGDPGPGYQLSLRSRTYMTNSSWAEDGKQYGDTVLMLAFLIITSRAGEPVTAESTVDVLYWFSNGVTYQTPEFNSGRAAQYAQDHAKHVVQGSPAPTLPAGSSRCEVGAGAILE